MTVAICIATYMRPDGLWGVLQSLNSLEFTRSSEPAVEVVVIDNDPDGSARATCDRARGESRWPIRYVHEPRRGISQVRNTAVEVTRESADFIAFIDDDEVAEPQWLDELMRVQQEHQADVVLGPAVRVFETEPPGWARRGHYFEDPRYPTGARVEHGGIGNALIRTGILPASGPAFDERFGVSGGEDTMFFLRLASRGAKIVWADEAIIQENVPAHRARLSYVLKRVYRTANTWSLCEKELKGSPRVVAARVGKGIARIAMGALLLPAAIVLGKDTLVRGLWQMCYGAGNLTGLLGFRYDAYRNVSTG